MIITRDIATSLTNAGIGSLYHNRTLSEESDLGLGYNDWIRTAGPNLKADGGLVVLHGLGQYAEVRLLARAFHLNGAGVRIKSLSQIVMTFRRGGEALEEMNDAPALFICSARASRRGCPLDHWDMELVVDYIHKRIDQKQIVVMHWDTNRTFAETDPLYQWWEEGFLEWLQDTAIILKMVDVIATGRSIREANV